jgi:hypothetical protein
MRLELNSSTGMQVKTWSGAETRTLEASVTRITRMRR